MPSKHIFEIKITGSTRNYYIFAYSKNEAEMEHIASGVINLFQNYASHIPQALLSKGITKEQGFEIFLDESHVSNCDEIELFKKECANFEITPIKNDISYYNGFPELTLFTVNSKQEENILRFKVPTKDCLAPNKFIETRTTEAIEINAISQDTINAFTHAIKLYNSEITSKITSEIDSPIDPLKYKKIKEQAYEHQLKPLESSFSSWLCFNSHQDYYKVTNEFEKQLPNHYRPEEYLPECLPERFGTSKLMELCALRTSQRNQIKDPAYREIEMILPGCNINATDIFGRTALMYIAVGNIMLQLLNRTPGRKEITKLLLNNGADPCVKDCDGKTALNYFEEYIGKDHPATLFLEKEIKKAELSKSLMELFENHEPNSKPGIAYKTIQSLILEGAHVNVSDNNGRTPLMHIALGNWTDQEKEKFTKLLLINGANPLLDDNCNQTAFDYFIKHLGIEHSATQYLMTKSHRLLRQLCKTRVSLTNKKGNAVYYDIQELIAHGADVNKSNKKGRTPLMYLAFVDETDTIELVRLLCRRGANLLIKDKKGEIALDYFKKRLGKEHPVTKMLSIHTTSAYDVVYNEQMQRLILESSSPPLLYNQESMQSSKSDYALQSHTTSYTPKYK